MKALARLLVCLLAITAFAQDNGKIFVVRHAEKQSNAEDTPLSSQGQARAECLAQTLRDTHISSVLVTQYLRTNQSAAPTVSESKARETALDANAYNQFVNTARAAAQSGNVLIVGHSNTIPKLMSAFGAPPVTIPDTAYDLLFIFDAQNPQRLTILHFCPNLPPGINPGPNSMAKP